MSADEPPPLPPLPPLLAGLSGLCMGAADAVPGVSGGTIALILGIYDRLLASIAALVRPPWLWRRADVVPALKFLVPLFAGIAAALWSVTRLLVGPKDAPGLLLRPETAPFCFAFFFGLVLLSLGEPWRRIRKRTPLAYVLALLGAAGAFLFVGLPHETGVPETWKFVPGGALAVCVMLLPGISGSLLLVILGLYTTVTGAFHGGPLVVLVAFAGGVVLGLAIFVPLLRKLLAVRHDATMAVLTGLMAGSLRALWPWKSGYDIKHEALDNLPPGDHVPGVIAAAVVGAVCVFALRWIERRIEERSQPEQGMTT